MPPRSERAVAILSDPPQDADLRAALHPRAVDPPRQRTLAVLLSLVLLTLVGAVATGLYFVLVPTDPATIASAGGGSARAAGAITPLPPPPPVEPVQYLDVPRDAARALNAAVPFSTEPNPPAAAAMLRLTPQSEARALDCLAAAVWYEAGDDTIGERAVAQVVLNRLRHRAFPKTVCGVVFQGSERATGCQFSFSCDGSIVRRTPGAAAWQSARAVAAFAMRGGVFAPVGWATHYHTDWVVPNWSSSVDKVARVGTHLFFRWRGDNGRAGAFRGTESGEEAAVAALARLSPAHAGDAAVPLADGAEEGVPVAAADVAAGPPAVPTSADLRGSVMRAGDATAGLYVIEVKPEEFSGTLALVAVSLCRGRTSACTVVGFAGSPGRVVPGALGRLTFPDRQPDFYYFSDPARGRETAKWNCRVFARPDPSQCLASGFVPNG